jgi:hypothetical protein
MSQPEVQSRGGITIEGGDEAHRRRALEVLAALPRGAAVGSCSGGL